MASTPRSSEVGSKDSSERARRNLRGEAGCVDHAAAGDGGRHRLQYANDVVVGIGNIHVPGRIDDNAARESTATRSSRDRRHRSNPGIPPTWPAMVVMIPSGEILRILLLTVSQMYR